jgi:hypothetical protein
LYSNLKKNGYEFYENGNPRFGSIVVSHPWVFPEAALEDPKR